MSINSSGVSRRSLKQQREVCIITARTFRIVTAVAIGSENSGRGSKPFNKPIKKALPVGDVLNRRGIFKEIAYSKLWLGRMECHLVSNSI